MRTVVNYTLGWTLANAFRIWLNENEIEFDSYEYGALYEVFEVMANEYEEEMIDDLLYGGGLEEYMGIAEEEEIEYEPY